ncbi:MAG: hypothetical protein KDN20_25130 [Verrucomicrobiae bacterium]|nr:hypothetical protein [Verrucomicrobiae bacterium]
MFTEWGVEDTSILVHSLGCNYLAALGRHLGFWAINEFPVKGKGGENIRPDAVWWNRSDKRVEFLAEFERFKPGKEGVLAQKAENLVHSYQSLDCSPPVVLLLGWALAGTDLTKAVSASSVAYNGFRYRDGHWVPGLHPDHRFLHYFAIFGQEKDGRLKILRISTPPGR